MDTRPAHDLNKRGRRSFDNTFMFSINCLFCGNFAKLCDGKRGHDVFEVRTLEFQIYNKR